MALICAKKKNSIWRKNCYFLVNGLAIMYTTLESVNDWNPRRLIWAHLKIMDFREIFFKFGNEKLFGRILNFETVINALL